jgi:hypothetical protein
MIFKLLTDSLFVDICRSNWLYSRKYGTVRYHPASSRFYLAVMTGTLPDFDARATCVKPANPACCVLGVRCWFYVNTRDKDGCGSAGGWGFRDYADRESLVKANRKQSSLVLGSPACWSADTMYCPSAPVAMLRSLTTHATPGRCMFV